MSTVIKSGSWGLIEAGEERNGSSIEKRGYDDWVTRRLDPGQRCPPSVCFPPSFSFRQGGGGKATRGKADNGMENNGTRVENTRGTSTRRRTNLEIMNQS